MDRWKFQQLVPFLLSDRDWERIDLVFMNTKEIKTMEQMSRIVANGMEYVDILYKSVLKCGALLETVGDLKKEISEVQVENRRLQDFRSRIVQAYKDMEHDGEC